MTNTKKTGILSVGAYIPYYYLERSIMGSVWGERGQKGCRSMANSDEDSLTMSVEAGRECLRHFPRERITHHFNATTTSPYEEKSGAVLVSTACCLNEGILSVDLNSSLRAGISALKLAFDTASADENATVLVTSADMRNAAPKSSDEQLFGDAAVALTVGSGEPIAVLKGFSSVDNEIHDYWRNSGDKVVRTTEQRFMTDEGYMYSVPEAVKDAMKKAAVSAENIKKFVVSTPGMREYKKAAAKCGFTPEQVCDPLMETVGNCGAAHALLILAYALESAQPGDIIVVAAYGTGASAAVFEVTGEIETRRDKFVSKFFQRRKSFGEYTRFLSFRGQLEPKQGEPFKIPAAPSISWREKNTYLKLYAGKCTKCGTMMFPASHVCYNCRSVDSEVEVSQTEAKSKLFSFSVDRLAGRSDDPIVVQAIADDDQGVRMYMNMTDVEENEVKIGMYLEFTFRKIHDLGGYPNYYWKFRPVRVAE